MKFITRLLYATALTILILTIILRVSGNGYVITALKRTYWVGEKTANINDHEQFETRIIKAGKASPLPKHDLYNNKTLPSLSLIHI